MVQSRARCPIPLIRQIQYSNKPIVLMPNHGLNGWWVAREGRYSSCYYFAQGFAFYHFKGWSLFVFKNHRLLFFFASSDVAKVKPLKPLHSFFNRIWDSWSLINEHQCWLWAFVEARRFCSENRRFNQSENVRWSCSRELTLFWSQSSITERLICPLKRNDQSVSLMGDAFKLWCGWNL